MLIDNPRKFILNSFEFSVEEASSLKTYFPQLDMVILDKSVVRSLSIIQKAMNAGALLYFSESTQDKVTLRLTQDGKSLIGKV